MHLQLVGRGVLTKHTSRSEAVLLSIEREGQWTSG